MREGVEREVGALREKGEEEEKEKKKKKRERERREKAVILKKVVGALRCSHGGW